MDKVKESLYIPALDGLRAISILIVFFSHQGYEDLIPGGLGVTIFFFISGYLITNLLFAEYRKTNRIDFKGFFIRRLLRLYPALLFMLILFSFFLLATGQRIETGEVFAALFYFENYYKVYFEPIAAHFSILWSLAIEEHFYLIFPFLFIGLVQKPLWLLLSTLVLVLLPLLLRVYTTSYHGINAFSEESTYYLTHCRFDSILLGCLLSIILNSGFKERFLQFVSNYFVYGLGLLLIVFTLLYRDEFFRQTYRYSLQGLAFIILIPPIVYSDRYKLLNALFSNHVLATIGRLSYSIYLFHWMSRAVFLYFGLEQRTIQWVIANVIFTAVLATVSYYGIEMKFVALRKRFGSNVKKEMQTASV